MKGPLVLLDDVSSDESCVCPVSTVRAAHRGKVRYKSDVHLCYLPRDVLILLLSELPLPDLIRMRRVNTMFHDLIDNTPSLWSTVSLHSVWPSQSNFGHLFKAANHWNVESLIKLGVSYLYNEGLVNSDKAQVKVAGLQAYIMFHEVEKLISSSSFTWIFYRPPWSVNGTCCKSVVLELLLQEANSPQCAKSVYYCIAKTLSFFDDQTKNAESLHWFRKAAEKGCAESALILWHHQYHNNVLDKASELESIRSLRDLVRCNSNCLEAQVMLCKLYAKNKLGGITRDCAISYVRQFFLSSKPPSLLGRFPLNRDLTPRVRQILVDWLVEVSNLKEFSTETIHLTIQMIDRYLLVAPVSKAELQLLGISSLLLCTRFLGKEILTVREAAWVTDNTYQYGDVVQMMGHIVAAIKGKLRVVIIPDFVEVLLSLTDLDEQIRWMTFYLSDICLLYPELSQFSQGVLAASCLVLAGLCIKNASVWSTWLSTYTGYDLKDLVPCILILHSKCSQLFDLEDFKSRKLEAIHQRYTGEKFCRVAEIKLVTKSRLEVALEISEAARISSLCLAQYFKEKLLAAFEPRNGIEKLNVSGYDADDEFDCETFNISYLG